MSELRTTGCGEFTHTREEGTYVLRDVSVTGGDEKHYQGNIGSPTVVSEGSVLLDPVFTERKGVVRALVPGQ